MAEYLVKAIGQGQHRIIRDGKEVDGEIVTVDFPTTEVPGTSLDHLYTHPLATIKVEGEEITGVQVDVLAEDQ